MEEYCEETKDLYDCGYDQGPFIPYTMPRYKESDLKIFYIGRDTYWWTPYEKLQVAYNNFSLIDYLKANVDCVDVDKMLTWKNNSGAFWTFVCKLHLYIKTGNYKEDITAINTKEHKYLEEIGYGNLYSIEVKETLQKEERGVWNSILDKDKYYKICEASKKFENLKTIIEAYNPDVIFITSWIDKDDFFNGTDFSCQKEYYEDGYRSVFLSKTYNTKIIWTLHPGGFRFKSITIVGSLFGIYWRNSNFNWNTSQ